MLIVANHAERKAFVGVRIDLAALGLAGQKVEVVDVEKDATWGKTVEDAYLKYIYTGPTLLPEEEQGLSLDRNGNTASLKCTIDAKDYRAVLIRVP